MKIRCKLLVALLLAGVAVVDAEAVTCAKGVYRAGCVAPGGAAVVKKPVAAPATVVVAPKPVVVAPVAPHCRMVNGRKVCT